MKPTNIAIFSDAFPPQVDGVANMAFRSAQGLAGRGHHVHVFTVGRKHDSNPGATEKFRVTAMPAVASGVYQGYRMALPSASWFPALREFKPDLIHSHTPLGVGWLAVLAARSLKVPLIATHHTFYDHYLKHMKLDYPPVRRLSWRYTVAYFNRCNLVVSPSRSLAHAMIEKGLKRPISILENFVDTGIFRPAADGLGCSSAKATLGIRGLSLTYMGRLSYEKNIEDALAAFSEALARRSDMTFVVIGDGPERKKLEHMAQTLRIADHVLFTGLLEGQSLVHALQANDAFITASRSENMPLSVLEAMAVGLPVIAVKEKGLGEIVEDGVNGRFAKTGDIADMSQKIVALLSDEAMRRKFGTASRKLALHYSRDRVMPKLEEIYQGAGKNREHENVVLRP